MSLTIWKHQLNLVATQEITVPKGAEFLCAREQRGEICVWFRCNPSKDNQVKTMIIHGTGHDVTPNGDYLGTVLLYGGDLVLHVFVQ